MHRSWRRILTAALVSGSVLASSSCALVVADRVVQPTATPSTLTPSATPTPSATALSTTTVTRDPDLLSAAVVKARQVGSGWRDGRELDFSWLDIQSVDPACDGVTTATASPLWGSTGSANAVLGHDSGVVVVEDIDAMGTAAAAAQLVEKLRQAPGCPQVAVRPNQRPVFSAGFVALADPAPGAAAVRMSTTGSGLPFTMTLVAVAVRDLYLYLIFIDATDAQVAQVTTAAIRAASDRVV